MPTAFYCTIFQTPNLAGCTTMRRERQRLSAYDNLNFKLAVIFQRHLALLPTGFCELPTDLCPGFAETNRILKSRKTTRSKPSKPRAFLLNVPSVTAPSTNLSLPIRTRFARIAVIIFAIRRLTV